VKTGTVTEEAPISAGARHFARQGPSRRWLLVFGTLVAVAAVAGAALTYVGVQTVRDSRAGQAVSTVTDPSAPGFEAFLEPSPTLAVLHRDGSSLLSIAVLSLNSGDAGGAVLLIPPEARSTTEADALSFGAVSGYGGGPTAVVPSLQSTLGFGILETVLVDDARWAQLVAPVSPLRFDNPQAVGPFPAGPIELPADQVGAYLAARNETESALAPLVRQRAFYDAWFAAIAASTDEAVVPGEVATGLGRFARGLANGPRHIESVPIKETPIEGGVRLGVDADAMAALTGEIVPFPTGGRPGGRVRVRLLDGTGDPDHVQSTAPVLAPVDGEIVVVGNADHFDYETTEIRYHTPVVKAAARAMRDALGGGRLIDDPRQTDAFDVTIVLGTDV
jgi:hypothetical protein